jgi:hypothetical protein
MISFKGLLVLSRVFFTHHVSAEFFFRSSLGFPVFDEERKSKLREKSKQFTFTLLLL